MEQKLNSFIEVSPQSDFTIHNLPYGIFSRTAEGERQVGVAIGDWVIDLAALEKHGLLKLSDQDTYFNQPTLNKFIESGKANWSKVRKTLQSLLSVDNLTLQENEALRQEVLVKQDSVTLHLPLQVSGYTDFYSSKEHATNVGCMFRDPKMPCFQTGASCLSVITAVLALLW